MVSNLIIISFIPHTTILHTDACINNGDVFLNTDGEENRGYRNLPRYMRVNLF